MTSKYDNAFTHSHTLMEDGCVSFKCDRDVGKWPWLALPSIHPIAVQTVNFWASVETGVTRGSFDPEKWSALTYSKWQVGDLNAGPVTHGIADLPSGTNDASKPSFRLTLFDEAGALVYRMIGAGVVFQTRNFEGWRKQAKEIVKATQSIADFEYAPASALGVKTDIERFLSPLYRAPSICADALITKENGLLPAHPYNSGSGDHVNANHIVDAGFQFAHQVFEKSLRCTGGEIKFRHYVELGKAFTLSQTSATETSISLAVHQNEKLCTDIHLQFAE